MVIRKWFNYWISKPRSGFFSLIAFFLVSCYIAGSGVGAYGLEGPSLFLKRAAFIGSLVLALAVLIHKNLHASYRFLELNRDTDRLPVRQISHVNSFCMTVFLIGVFLSIVLLTAATDPLWKAIADWLADRPPIEIPEETRYMGYFPEGDAAALPLPEILGEPSPPSPAMQNFSRIVEVLGYVLIGAFLILILREAVIAVLRFFTRPRNWDRDEKIYLKPTLRINAHPERDVSDKKETEGGSRLSFSARIRRLYKKRILNARKQKKAPSVPPQWASPRELESDSGIFDENLHRLYEKARYSREECTGSDWSQLNGP